MSEIEFGLLVFTSLFTVVNPFGAIPIYLTLTKNLDEKGKARVARNAILTAVIILLVFTISGSFIFKFFGISIDSLRVVGGVIFFLMGYDMLGGRIARTKGDKESVQDYTDDISITPLGIPTICGPGSITIVILMIDSAKGLLDKVAFFIALVLVFLGTYVILVGGQRIIELIGPSGNKVFLRIMGIIVMMIAVEFFFSGLKGMLHLA